MKNLVWLLLLGACGHMVDTPEEGGPDAAVAEVDGPAEPVTCDPTAPFGPPVAVAGLATDDAAEEMLRLSPDERTAYVSGFFGGADDWDIVVAERASIDEPFGAPVPLSIDTDAHEFDPTVSADGLTILFGSTRLDGNQDIFVATRASTADDFGTPVPVTALNSLTSTDSDGQPFLTADGHEVWFHSDRAGGDGANDIYRAAWTGAGFATPERVAELSSPADEWMPVLSADGLTVYFSSNRAGSQGYDVWVARRTSTSVGFSTPTPVVELATTASDHPTWISADNCRLYLMSGIAGQDDDYVAVRSPTR